MNRNEFQRIARARVADARVLLGAKRYSGAYYLCGYAIECALKACIGQTDAPVRFSARQRSGCFLYTQLDNPDQNSRVGTSSPFE
jgi:hypothetical protein